MIKPLKASSLLDMKNGTILEMQIFKPHAGKIQVIAIAPNGNYKVLFDWNLNAQPLIDQNMKDEILNPLPTGWPTDHHIYKGEPK